MLMRGEPLKPWLAHPPHPPVASRRPGAVGVKAHSMEVRTEDPSVQLRTLESWLPLAQAENEAQGWGYDGPTLERLILLAAPSLRQAHSLIAARALLWHYREHLQRGNNE